MEPFRPDEGEEIQRNLGKNNRKKMAEMGKTWDDLRWLAQNRSNWRKLVCFYASQGAESERRTLIMWADPKTLKGFLTMMNATYRSYLSSSSTPLVLNL